jgi:hypothetical protein
MVPGGRTKSNLTPASLAARLSCFFCSRGSTPRSMRRRASSCRARVEPNHHSDGLPERGRVADCNCAGHCGRPRIEGSRTLSRRLHRRRPHPLRELCTPKYPLAYFPVAWLRMFATTCVGALASPARGALTRAIGSRLGENRHVRSRADLEPGAKAQARPDHLSSQLSVPFHRAAGPRPLHVNSPAFFISPSTFLIHSLPTLGQLCSM